MVLSKRIYGAALMGAVVVVTGISGCGPANELCCTEFKVGAQLDAKIGGGADSQVAVQAVADFAGIASASIDDLTTAAAGDAAGQVKASLDASVSIAGAVGSA